MKDLYFFDTDCLSSFLSIDRHDILLKLYKNNIYIPSYVYQEIIHAPKNIVDNFMMLIEDNKIQKIDIVNGTKEYKEFIYLVKSNLNNKKIGYGEASAIALVKTRGGVLASNNLKDIEYYVKEYKLDHTTTSDILVEALKNEIINVDEGNHIWEKLKDYRMPTKTFDDYLKNTNK